MLSSPAKAASAGRYSGKMETAARASVIVSEAASLKLSMLAEGFAMQIKVMSSAGDIRLFLLQSQ